MRCFRARNKRGGRIEEENKRKTEKGDRETEGERESTSDIAYLPADSLQIYIINSDAK